MFARVPGRGSREIFDHVIIPLPVSDGFFV